LPSQRRGAEDLYTQAIGTDGHPTTAARSPDHGRPSTWTVIRNLLTADLTLTADQVIAKAQAKGVKAPRDAIRTTVYDVRKKLKQKAAAKPVPAVSAPPPKAASKPAVAAKPAPAPKPVAAAKAAPAAARQTPAPSTSAVLRSILAADLALPADAVIARAKARGVTAPDRKLRDLVHNLKSELKR
jgi:hypothetical protein